MKHYLSFLLLMFISGCVFINGAFENKPSFTVTTEVSTEKNTVNENETCLLTDYEEVIKLPELPSFSEELKQDNIYVEKELVKSIDAHRKKLKQLKTELENCKNKP